MLRHEVDGHAGCIDDEPNRSRRPDQRLFWKVESEERGGPDAALVSDKAAEHS